MIPMSKGQETKEAILDTAVAIASEVGLEALSIGGLAKEVGLSKSGLFAHFESKENLELEVLRTVVERFIREGVAPALREPRGEPRVRALFDAWLEWTKASSLPGGCLFISSATELDDRPGPVRDYLVSQQRDWHAALSKAAGIAVDEGHFRPGLDLDQFAFDLQAIILAYHYFARLMHDARAESRTRRAFEALIQQSCS